MRFWLLIAPPFLACVPRAPPPAPLLWSSTHTPPTTSGAWTMFHHDPLHAGASPIKPARCRSLVWRLRTGGEVRGSPAIGPDSTECIGSTDGKVYAIDGHTGTQRWTVQTLSAAWAGPAVAPDATVYTTSGDHHLYALRANQPEGIA